MSILGVTTAEPLFTVRIAQQGIDPFNPLHRCGYKVESLISLLDLHAGVDAGLTALVCLSFARI